MLPISEIICGECSEVMSTFPDECVDLTITSPPYDGLRDYLGYKFDFEAIAKQLYRVTKQGGVVVWVVGDETKNGSESGTSFRQALRFKEIGFNLHDTMIYEKINPIPLNHNRYEQGFEFMFVLSKGIIKTFNPIKIPCSTAGVDHLWSNHKSDPSGKSAKKNSGKTQITGEYKIARNIFKYGLVGVRETGKHPAPFPEQLAADHIRSWSNEGDIVLDCMAGSGTVLKAARKLGRKYIGIEMSEEYCKIIEERLSQQTLNFEVK